MSSGREILCYFLLVYECKSIILSSYNIVERVTFVQNKRVNNYSKKMYNVIDGVVL